MRDYSIFNTSGYSKSDEMIIAENRELFNEMKLWWRIYKKEIFHDAKNNQQLKVREVSDC